MPITLQDIQAFIISGTVANYSALPAANTVPNQYYWVLAEQGTWWLPGSLGGTYYNKGIYRSNGTIWEFQATPANASQATVDAGTDDTQFVTPLTLANSAKLTNKLSKVSVIAFSHSTLNPADSTTYFFGSNIVSNAANTTSTALRRGYSPLTGFVYAGLINVQVSSTLGSPEAVTVTLNNKTQGTSVVLSSSVVYSVISNGFSFELGSPFAINANDSLEIKIDTPVFATNPISVINLVTLYCGTKS